MARLKNFKQKYFWILLISLGLLALTVQLWPTNWYARAQVRDVLLKSAPPDQLVTDLEPYIKVGESYEAIHHRLAPQPASYRPLTNNTDWTLQVGDGVGLHVAMRANGEVVGIGRWRRGVDQDHIEWLAKPAW